MNRVICLIDGFNLYHVLSECHPKYSRWCNYRKLIEQFIRPGDKLIDVHYFTALAKWDAGKVARHAVFIKALRHFGVNVILGNFKRKYPKCRNCRKPYETYEEKESDVSLGVKLVVEAYEDAYDKAIIVSSDSDFVSAITTVKVKFPSKKIGVLIPYNRRKPHIGNHIRRSSDFSENIERGHILSSRLPNSITLKSGEIVTCPPEYSMPEKEHS